VYEVAASIPEGSIAPGKSTVHRILCRHGLIEPGRRRGKRCAYRRWERDVPMALWQIDIVGGLMLADGTECKGITGVDDHARFSVMRPLWWLAHLTIVFAAIAVARFVEDRTGWSIRKFAHTARRYRTVHIQAGQHLLTAEGCSQPTYATRLR
jgi:hypothetical protein